MENITIKNSFVVSSSTSLADRVVDDANVVCFDVKTATNPIKRRVALTKITKQINKNTALFLLGKTGNPKQRIKKYPPTSIMFLLAKSPNENIINQLEAHYNNKYLGTPLNVNKKGGSAGKMTKSKCYYLYQKIEV